MFRKFSYEFHVREIRVNDFYIRINCEYEYCMFLSNAKYE